MANFYDPYNGDILSIHDGTYAGISGSVPVGEIMIDGDAAGDVGDVVMRDRELLGEDGVLLVVSNINPRTKKVLTQLEIISKGFTYLKENDIPFKVTSKKMPTKDSILKRRASAMEKIKEQRGWRNH